MLVSIVMWCVRQYIRLCAWSGYKSWVRDETETILVACCTNGLGHVHQLERVLRVLHGRGFRFPVIAFAALHKVPVYKLNQLRAAYPETSIVDMDFEVSYDTEALRFEQVLSRSLWQILTGIGRWRRVAALLSACRPAYCLSFWEPTVPTVIDAFGAPVKVVSVASQGQIYCDTGCSEKDLLQMRVLREFNLGRRGTLVPFALRQMEGAIPQIVNIPPVSDVRVGQYFVAYSVIPSVLESITRLPYPIVWFVKQHEVAKYRQHCRDRPNIEVRPTGTEFMKMLAQSGGLIASPSRGVVTQAIVMQKPVYLLCPSGHVEQCYNERYYKRYVTTVFSGLPRHPPGSIVGDGCAAQDMRHWLEQSDSLIQARLTPLLRTG